MYTKFIDKAYLDDSPWNEFESRTTFPERVQDNGKGGEEGPDHANHNPRRQAPNAEDSLSKEEGKWYYEEHDD